MGLNKVRSFIRLIVVLAIAFFIQGISRPAFAELTECQSYLKDRSLSYFGHGESVSKAYYEISRTGKLLLIQTGRDGRSHLVPYVVPVSTFSMALEHNGTLNVQVDELGRVTSVQELWPLDNRDSTKMAGRQLTLSYYGGACRPEKEETQNAETISQANSTIPLIKTTTTGINYYSKGFAQIPNGQNR